jgi:hypothetical protein
MERRSFVPEVQIFHHVRASRDSRRIVYLVGITSGKRLGLAEGYGLTGLESGTRIQHVCRWRPFRNDRERAWPVELRPLIAQTAEHYMLE